MGDYYDDPRSRPRRVEVYRVEGRASGRPTRQMDLIRRENEDGSIEEIQREFPPAGQVYVRRDGGLQPRSQSLERDRGYGYGAYGYDARRVDGDMRSQASRREERPRHRGRSLSRGRELAAAAAGAGLAIGGKQLLDRREGAKHRSKSRSRLETVAVGVAGAAAGDVVARQYAKKRGKHRDVDDYGREGSYVSAAYDHGYSSSNEYDDRARPRPSRRKSIGEAALAALGLGNAANAGSHRDKDDRSRRRHRRPRSSSTSSSSRSPSRGRGGDTSKKLQQAAQAAITAAAVEAWRSRKEPGGYFQGEKARRILTAAAGAGGIDALVDRDPDEHERRHVGQGLLGGLIVNRLVNGPPRDEDFGGRNGRRSRDSRSRSRSQGETLKGLGAAGIAAGVAKKLLDRSRSSSRSRYRRSHSRSRSRRGSLKDVAAAGLAAVGAKKFVDSRDDRSRSRERSRRHRRYSSSSSGSVTPPSRRRSKSVTDYVDKGLAKLGIGDKKEGSRGSDRGSRDLAVTGGASRGGGDGRSRGGDSDCDHDHSDMSLSEEERKHRKLKGKEYLTAGLASVATIHAAHELYESYEKHKKRVQAVKEGKLSPEEAKKLKRKAYLRDAVTVGLAGLGVKGTYESWQEANEQRKEVHEHRAKLEECRRNMTRNGKRQQRLGGVESWRRSAPDLSVEGGGGGGGQSYGGSGPVYQDGNPYAMR